MTTDGVLERIVDGRTDLVWDYVAGGHAATTQTSDGVRLLECCAYFGDVSAMRFLLEHGESLKSLGENLGLQGAAFHGHWQLSEFLIESGANANAASAGTGETPLHSALCSAHSNAQELVVGVLLNHAADPNRATKASMPTGDFMRDCRTRGETPLHRAGAFGSEASIDLLLAAGAKREAQDANGDTPLSWASWYARPDGILRRLCFGSFTIHPDRQSMERALRGRAHGRA